jgi:uncharacterized protein with von Willebrand factor type A (vWA) domain
VSEELQLPRAARVFISFVALLRANGFSVAPEQTTAFLAAIELLGPHSIEHIRQAGIATLAPPPERRATYDRLFDIHFRGSEAIERAEGEDEETVRLQEEGRGEDEPPLSDEANESGLAAARAEAFLLTGQPMTRCAVSPAKPLADCLGAAAIAACAPGAAPLPICAVPCATACATMARC